MLKFDEHSLQQTAKAVLRLNPACAGMSEESLISAMKATAELNISDEPSCCGTLGFYLTTYRHPGGEGLGCVATVMSFLVNTYLDSLN